MIARYAEHVVAVNILANYTKQLQLRQENIPSFGTLRGMFPTLERYREDPSFFVLEVNLKSFFKYDF